MDGYVRLHRTLPDWEWYNDDACLRLLIHLLMRVNWKPGKWKGIDVVPGSTITSIERLADSLGWSRSKLRHTMDKMKSSGDIATTTTNHWTTVTLVNWAKYQNNDQPSSQPSDQPTANQWPTEQPTNSQPSATIEEGKKERRKELLADKPPVELVWPKWAGPNTKAKWTEFKEYRRTVDRFRYKSEASEQAALNTLGKYYKSGEDAVAGLDLAMAKGWKFPVDPKELAPKQANGRPAEMSKADADRALDDLRAKHGIAPGGFIETHLIPKDVLEAIRRP